jgi:transcriptional regulator GlxA family with amidase domain
MVRLTMNPKRIGFLGFEGVASSHLVGPADTFAAAALDGGYGNRIPCYQICTIGLTPEPFRAESGIIFKPDETLQTAPDLDTVVVPGGEGLRRAAINEKISNWILARDLPVMLRGASQSCVLIIEDRSSKMVRFIPPPV